MTQSPPDELRTAAAVDRTEPGSAWRVWLALFLAAFALYAATANRGAQWQDSGFHILRGVTGQLYHPLGLALVHPLHHGLARLAANVPGVEPCFAITLLSALAAAAAVANTYGCVWTLTRHRGASLLAAGSLGLAHTFWRMATLAEVNTLVAALLSAECWCVLAYTRRRDMRLLCGAMLINGLGIANHNLGALTTAFVLGLLVEAVRSRAIRGRHVLVAIGLWLVGSLPYTGLVGGEMVRTGDVGATVVSALFGTSFADEVLNLSVTARMLVVVAAFVVLNFPNLLLPASLYGFVRGRRLDLPALARTYLVGALLFHAWFAVRYGVVDQHLFFLPTYVLLSIFGGIGFAAMRKQWRASTGRAVLGAATAALMLTPLWYAFVPTVARHFDVLRSVSRNKPYRDDYVYLFTPWSVVERSADAMSRHAVELAGDDGVILVEDAMAEYAIRYRAIRAGRENVHITVDITPEVITGAAAAGRAVVLVPKNADAPATRPLIGTWRRSGDLYVLVVERLDS